MQACGPECVVGGLWPKEISEESITLPLVGPLLVGGVLVLVSLSLYLAALPVALVARQPAVVFLAGFAIWWAGFATFTLAVDAELSVSWELVGWLNVGLLTPLLAVALVLALAGRRLRFNRAAAWRFSRRARMAGLLWKSVTENTLLQAMCIAFLVVALIVPQADSLAVTGVGLILIAALGTAAYDPVEKHGLHCVLYQHPVPRSQLFWAKTMAAIAPVLAVSAGAYVLWGRQSPMPFLTALALGSFAYACAVLLTLAFRRQLTAALATVVVVFLTLICPVLILELLMPHATSLLSIVSSDEISGPGFIALQATAFPTALLAVGCLWAARRMATDRTVLTGSASYRLSYFAGIYAVIVSVSALLTMAAWGGLISFLSRG